jgi:hypothetical protein
MTDPIEPKYREWMNDFARSIDKFLNGDAATKRTGFVVLMFDFGDNSRMNYISNAQREDMLPALRELLAHFEGRAHTPPKGTQ